MTERTSDTSVRLDCPQNAAAPTTTDAHTLHSDSGEHVALGGGKWWAHMCSVEIAQSPRNIEAFELVTSGAWPAVAQQRAGTQPQATRHPPQQLHVHTVGQARHNDAIARPTRPHVVPRLCPGGLSCHPPDCRSHCGCCNALGGTTAFCSIGNPLHRHRAALLLPDPAPPWTAAGQRLAAALLLRSFREDLDAACAPRLRTFPANHTNLLAPDQFADKTHIFPSEMCNHDRNSGTDSTEPHRHMGPLLTFVEVRDGDRRRALPRVGQAWQVLEQIAVHPQ